MKHMFFLLMLILLSSCINEISISACPTMHNLLDNNDIFLLESSSKGFLAVKDGNYDFVVTGRPPDDNEKAGLQTIIIREGYTIIGPMSANVFLSELSSIRISNCANNNTIDNLLLIPCDTYPESNNLRIISWNEWKGEPFVTVYDDATRLKSMEFRGIYLTGRMDDTRIRKLANKIHDMI